MVKNEPHVFCFVFFSPLYNTAVVLCSIPPTQCKFLLLYNYYYCWVDCLNKNADFIWKPIALNLLNFYAKKRMYRQSCHDQKLVKALIYSGHFPKKSWFSHVHFNPVPVLSPSTFCTQGVQVELSKVWVFRARPWGDFCRHMTGRIERKLQTAHTSYHLIFWITMLLVLSPFYYFCRF